jgi:hypothetical protein
MKFMVTGHGRSGTTFLARALNRAPGWTVEHEALAPAPGSPGDIAHRTLISPRMVREHFNGKADHYGMVNGYLRTHGHHAPVDVKAIILRCPFDVALSVHNRGNWDNFLACCEQDYQHLDWMARRSDFITFRFADMFQMESFGDMANKLGVENCPVTPEFLARKVNQGLGRDTKLPRHRQNEICGRLRWFKDAWNL